MVYEKPNLVIEIISEDVICTSGGLNGQVIGPDTSFPETDL